MIPIDSHDLLRQLCKRNIAPLPRILVAQDAQALDEAVKALLRMKVEDNGSGLSAEILRRWRGGWEARTGGGREEPVG